MLCSGCTAMLQDPKGLSMYGTTGHTFDHHKSATWLQKSAEAGCSICTVLFRAVEPGNHDRPLPFRAVLERRSTKPGEGMRFQLHVMLGRKHECSFMLDEIKSLVPLRRVKTFSTAPNDAIDVANKWIETCRCADAWEQPGKKWYPKRLLDIEALRSGATDLERVRVRLIESDAFFGKTTVVGTRRVHVRPNARFITLSHCWGKPREGYEPLKLTDRTMKRFMTDGIELRDFPQTFQDTLLFASRLDDVRFVWIDSLCIRQPLHGKQYNREEQLRDWVEQSRDMDKVYRKSYLNISATASTDGHGGLFRDRHPQRLQQDAVDVYYPFANKSGTAPFTRCTLTHDSGWVELVDHAPINKRGWVFQERLLAPRILHFCRDQVAWECQEFDDAESFQKALVSVKEKTSGTTHGRVKDLTLSAGLRYRELRLNGLEDPDRGMPDLYIFELWHRVVEGYAKTELTYTTDKLLALAGIARHFQRHLFSGNTRNEYLAGMWSRNLESQLLWHVNEDYRDGVFRNPAKRVKDRAPSFSWAAIDTPYGVTCSDVTDYGMERAGNTSIGKTTVATSHPGRTSMDVLGAKLRIVDLNAPLFFQVVDYAIPLVDVQNPFGMVRGGHLLLQPRYLHRIELVALPKERGVPYCWHLKPRPALDKRSRWNFDNNFFDAPASDTDVFKAGAELFVMFAAYGERTAAASERVLYCLLLISEGPTAFQRGQSPAATSHRGGYRTFRRFGLSKVPQGHAEGMIEALAGQETNEVIYLS